MIVSIFSRAYPNKYFVFRRFRQSKFFQYAVMFEICIPLKKFVFLSKVHFGENFLLSFFFQEYIAKQRFVHRDLAARNVLVCADKSIKISDFGLTRDVYQNNVYKCDSTRKIPYKWMPIETLFEHVFTTKSDV